MLRTLKGQLKTYAKSLISSYRQRQILGYFAQKTQQYLSIHQNLKPLPQDHKEAVLAYWSKFIRGGGD